MEAPVVQRAAAGANRVVRGGGGGGGAPAGKQRAPAGFNQPSVPGKNWMHQPSCHGQSKGYSTQPAVKKPYDATQFIRAQALAGGYAQGKQVANPGKVTVKDKALLGGISMISNYLH